jgi:ABC-type branched-subunit amino acid transport system permease subunit
VADHFPESLLRFEECQLSTFNGLPAHVLLVHFIVVLGPLTAVLATVCAFWPSARQRLVWLVLALAVITAVLTPLTTDAGEWLEKRKGRSPLLHAHTELGDTMVYFSIALVAAAALIAFVHLREARGKSLKPIARWLIAAVVVIASVATTVQVYRIGDSGAKATWSTQSAVGSSMP